MAELLSFSERSIAHSRNKISFLHTEVLVQFPEKGPLLSFDKWKDRKQLDRLLELDRHDYSLTDEEPSSPIHALQVASLTASSPPGLINNPTRRLTLSCPSKPRPYVRLHVVINRTILPLIMPSRTGNLSPIKTWIKPSHAACPIAHASLTSHKVIERSNHAMHHSLIPHHYKGALLSPSPSCSLSLQLKCPHAVPALRYPF